MQTTITLCLLLSAACLAVTLPHQLVGLSMDLTTGNATLATILLNASRFETQINLPFVPNIGIKDTHSSLYYAITNTMPHMTYFINVVNTSNWQLLRSVPIPALNTTNWHLDGFQVYKQRYILAVMFHASKDVRLIRLDTQTGDVTIVLDLQGLITRYYAYSSTLDHVNNIYYMLVDMVNGNNKVLIKVNLLLGTYTVVKLQNNTVQNQFTLFLRYVPSRQTIIGFATFAEDKQGLFELDQTNGALKNIFYLNAKWNCDAASFTYDEAQELIVIEVDSGSMCFMDKHETVLTLDMTGRVLQFANYLVMPWFLLDVGLL